MNEWEDCYADRTTFQLNRPSGEPNIYLFRDAENAWVYVFGNPHPNALVRQYLDSTLTAEEAKARAIVACKME